MLRRVSTTVNPIVQFGLPVFVDIDAKTHNIDADLIESHWPKTKAIMLAHTLGNVFNLGKVKALCESTIYG